MISKNNRQSVYFSEALKSAVSDRANKSRGVSVSYVVQTMGRRYASMCDAFLPNLSAREWGAIFELAEDHHSWGASSELDTLRHRLSALGFDVLFNMDDDGELIAVLDLIERYHRLPAKATRGKTTREVLSSLGLEG